MCEKTHGSVDIGFVDECESWRLESRFFPSKVGGRPAWLHLSDLPLPSDLECRKCKAVCILLCQVYAPIETDDDCFHRTLFVFLCRSPGCCVPNNSSSFIVLRSQLGRKNSFYPFDAPQESETWHPEVKVDKWSDVCVVCGNRGPSHCGRCKKVKYCSRSHQLIHWKQCHKDQCGKDNDKSSHNFSMSILLPEFELLTEPEGDACKLNLVNPSRDDSETDSEEDDVERLRDFEELKLQGKAGTLAEVENIDADLMSMAAVKEDTAFTLFKNRISLNPDQVLRYERGGVPLWISDEHVPTDKDIEPCPYCGSQRVFEFQILPQLLNHLSLDAVDQSVDWGVLAIFTCEKSCSEGPAYKAEYVWKQDVSLSPN